MPGRRTGPPSGPVTGEAEIRSGDVFLVSSTPVRVRLVDAPLPEMPFPRVLRGEAWPDPDRRRGDEEDVARTDLGLASDLTGLDGGPVRRPGILQEQPAAL